LTEKLTLKYLIDQDQTVQYGSENTNKRMFLQNIQVDNTGIYVFVDIVLNGINKLPGREAERIFMLVLVRSPWTME